MQEHLPLDSPLGGIYRVGGALAGLILLAFAALGLFSGAEFLTVDGERVLGLGTNGLSSVIFAVLGLILLAGAAIGGNLAASTNTTIGTVLLVSGMINLAVLRTDANFLSFRMSNVIFNFVVGTMLLTFGLYGRVSGGDPRGEDEAPERGNAEDSRPLGSRTDSA